MKHTILVLLSLIAPLHHAHSQGQVTSNEMLYMDTLRAGIQLEMPIPTDNAKDLFKDFMDTRYDVGVDGLGFLANKDDVSMENVRIPVLGQANVDLFSRFGKALEGSTSLSLTGRETGGEFFSEESDELARVKDLMNDFRLFAQEKYFTARLEERTDLLEDLTKDHKDAMKKIADNKDDIQKNLEKNRDLEKGIKDLERTASELEEKINGAKSGIGDIKSKISGLK